MGPRVVCLVAFALGGCLTSPSLVCSDGTRCPVSTACDLIHGSCVLPSQLEVCLGEADGNRCMFGARSGICDREVCIPIGCGNNVVDLGESCDDGNTTSGDGCRADCHECNDGVVDDGEGCDDSNTNPADGCDACVLTTWRPTAVIGGTANATFVGLASPSGVAVDRRGNLYLADTHNIHRIDTIGIITRLAGTEAPGFSGDGGAATSAQLDSPQGVAVDGLGNVYFADSENHRIRRVDASGVITTIAGTGTAGFSGDGGLATNATLNYPNGVAVDGLGAIYIADTFNHRIRRVAVSGIITTVVGIGIAGFAGDGGAATGAQLTSPIGVVVDSLDNIYIADTDNYRIRRVAASGLITTIAGSGTRGFSGDGGVATSAQLDSPDSIAVDAGNIYFSDKHRVRRVDPNGVITTIAGAGTGGFSGDGVAINAQLNNPQGVAVGGLGEVYVADTHNHRLRRIATTGEITTVAGTGIRGFSGDGGAATCAPLASPQNIAVDSLGNVYIADRDNDRIRRVDANGVITTVAGNGTPGFSGDGGAATIAQLADPVGVAVDGAGNVFIADLNNHRIRRVDASGVITTIAGAGTVGFAGDGGAATSAWLNSPRGVAVDAVGNLYVADAGNRRIRRVDATGVITTIAGNGTFGFAGDGGAAISAELAPRGVAVGVGNVYIADSVHDRIRRVDASGIITTVAGIGTPGFSGDGGAATSAQLSSPESVTVDGAGNIYVADTNNYRIRRVAATGVITTVAGSGISGFLGDGGAAIGAQLTLPHGVAIDGTGNLYLSDAGFIVGDHSIRRIAPTGVLTSVVGLLDPQGVGPFAQARLADPRALVVAPFGTPLTPFTFVAGGTTGTVQAAGLLSLEVVAGRYPHAAATGSLARFRDKNFGSVSGIAYDSATGSIYLSESSSNRIHVVTVVDPADESTWTIAVLAGPEGVPVGAPGSPGFADGAAQTAQFRTPTGLFFDAAARRLYVADTGNHVIRSIELSSGVVSTVAGTPATRGFDGDDGAATAALLFAPQAITRSGNGDLFIADTGNHRVRRVASATGTITTVLGAGVAASSGEGAPAKALPVNAPLGLVCDAIGNLFVTSTTTVRMLPAVGVIAGGPLVVDGNGVVQTIYGLEPRDEFPAGVTRCLTGVAVVDPTTVHVVDSCTGLLVELRLAPK